MIELINFQGDVYPQLQSEGFAAQYAIPFAKKVLRNNQTIFDVGCNRREWAYPGSVMIDPVLNNYNAMNFPNGIKPDAIFSSHCLEHYNGSWVEVLEYWKEQLCKNGIVFLYLPHYNQKYWHSWHNKKHIHNFTPQMLKDYFEQSGGWTNIFVTEGYDLNHSFYGVAEKS
jgi:hypothetical protein